MKRTKRPRAGRAATGMIAALLGGGCASLDATPEMDQASAIVESRSGAATGWDRTWRESDAWDGAAPLGADVAVRTALRNNRAMRQAVESIVAQRADYVQAHLLPNPVITFAYGFPTDGLGGSPLVLNLVQQLSWLWVRPAAIDTAEQALRAQVLAVSDAALRLVADTRAAHADVVLAERALALHEENLTLIDQSIAALRDRFAVGEASRLDLNRVELDRLQAETRLEDRRGALAEAKRHLLVRLGRADAGTAWRTDDAIPDAARTVSSLREADVVALASAQRLDVAAACAAFDGARARVSLAERGALPDVAAGVGYQENFSDRPGVFPSVAVTPKIFDDNRARLARAESELRRAELEVDRVRQAAIGEARAAWVRLANELDVVGAYDGRIVALAEDNLALARVAFDLGESDLTVLLEAQRRLNLARIESTDRRRAMTRELLELERAVGGSFAALPEVEVVITAQRDASRETTP